MSEQELAAIERIFPLLTAYGEAIEAGEDPAIHLSALEAEMRQNPVDMRTAIETAKIFQEMAAENPSTPDIENYTRAPQRLARLKNLEDYFENPEFAGVDFVM